MASHVRRTKLRDEVPRRRAEKRDTPRGRRDAHRMDYPNEREFGAAEFIDDEGRHYRLAYAHKLGGWTPGTVVPPRPPAAAPLKDGLGRVRLWLKLPRGRSRELAFGPNPPPNTVVQLYPAAEVGQTAPPVVVRVAAVDQERARRTGAILVQGLE